MFCSLFLNFILCLVVACLVKFSSLISNQACFLVISTWRFHLLNGIFFTVCWSLGVWVESVLWHYSSAQQHPPSFWTIFLSMINTGLWSFSWKWRIEQQFVLVTCGLEASFKERGPHLTGSEGHTPTILFWSSSFDHLSYPFPTPLCGSQNEWTLNRVWICQRAEMQQMCVWKVRNIF